MKTFSIFEQALKFSGVDQIENLGEIASLARRDFVERESFICHTTTASVEYGCLMIENAILLRTNRSGRVYAGVEKFSALQPIIDRYMRIADVSERVYLFGENDWEPPRHPNMRAITFCSDARLAREWFVVAHSPALSVALAGVDEDDDDDDATALEERTFRALKTHDPALVQALASAAESLIDDSLGH